MPTTSTALILSGIAAKTVVEAVVNDLYELGKDCAAQQVRKWKVTSHIDSIAKHIRQIRLVKTILQPEKAVDLTTFYYPAQVVVEKKRRIVHRLSDMANEGCIVIEGTAGQGKSIFLRYLASTEFFSGRNIPVFIELRRIRQGETLVANALQELKVLGFDMTADLFHLLAEQGRLVLLLDAFDEAKEELCQDLITEIEGLIRQHDKLRIVISSRPQRPIANSPFVTVFKLCPLEGKEYEGVLKRIAHDESTADAIIAGIKHETVQVASLLTTPLMVALLMIRYRIDQSLPQNSAAFYDQLFTILLQRHDKMKGGYVRPRKSKLTDLVLQEFFNALCYITKKADATSFSHKELCEHAGRAMEAIACEADVEKTLDDVVTITCLIVSDGDDYRFIHKSVREHGAALFIKTQPEEMAIRFYSGMELQWHSWSQELAFLQIIDRYRFLKYFYIPAMQRLFAPATKAADVRIDRNRIVRIFGNDGLATDPLGISLASTYQHWPTWDAVWGSKHLSLLLNLSKRREELKLEPTVNLSQLLELPQFQSQIESECADFCRRLVEAFREAEEFIARPQKVTGLFDF